MTLPGVQGPTLTVRHTGQVFQLGRAPITIGGQEDNTIILADPEVSPLHTIISWQAGSYTVVDVGSARGTYLDERRLRGPRPLRNGSVLRVGNTLFDVRIPSEGGATVAAGAGVEIGGRADAGVQRRNGSVEGDSVRGGKRGRPSVPVVVGMLIGGFVVLCLVAAGIFFLLDTGRGSPNVALLSPAEGAQVAIGESIVLKASATGARDITRLDLSVDGNVVGSTQSSGERGQATLTATLPWTFDTAGAHTVTATAYRAGRRTGRSSSHQVMVLDTSGGGTPGPTPPGTATPPATPSPTGTETPTPTPTATGTPEARPLPAIEFFRANPGTIDLGTCTTLEWGQVTYAVAATIDHGLGGVATPGSQVVCPTETTDYVMSASGPGGVTTLSVTVTVLVGQPDLVVESIAFTPYPPVVGEDTLVQIRFANTGTAATGAFAWEWQAGSAGPFSGMVLEGVRGGESTIVSVTWRPDDAYTELLTVARVDSGGSVSESDETNNQLQQTIQVVASSTTLALRGDAVLDGYVTGGQGAYSAGEIRVGNEEDLVHRGFLSFDLRPIPAGATIEGVQLRFYQLDFLGRPYQKLGRLTLTLLDYGSSLDLTDFSTPGLGPLPLVRQDQPGSWVEVPGGEIGPWLEQARNAGLEWLQLRLQFESEFDGDGEADYVRLEAGDNSLGTGNLPELTITYSMP